MAELPEGGQSGGSVLMLRGAISYAVAKPRFLL